MADLVHPHDLFFKTIFSHLDLVDDALTNNIPQLVDLIAPNTLERVSNEFVNPGLESFYSDLLLKANLKAELLTELEAKLKTLPKNKIDSRFPAYFYLLMEHKSNPEWWMAYDLLNLSMQIWSGEDKRQLLPYIYPIVIYHGKRPWKAPRDFGDLLLLPPLEEAYIPRFRYFLLDLSAFRDDQIKGKPLTRVGLLILKHIYDDDFDKKFPEIFGLLQGIKINEKSLILIIGALKYVTGTTNKISKENIQHEVQRVLPGQGEKIMPRLADQWIEEGKQLGLAKGRQEGLLEGLELALERKFGDKGLKFFRRIAKQADLETLSTIQNSLRHQASLSELKKRFKQK